MTIVQATAAIGAQSYAVTGYTNPVGNGGSTTATSTVPGGTNGTIVLSVTVSWPDHYTANAQRVGDVAVGLRDDHDAGDDDDHDELRLRDDHDDAARGHDHDDAPLRLHDHDDAARGDDDHDAPLRVHDHDDAAGDHDHRGDDTTTEHVTTTTDYHELGSTTLFTTTTRAQGPPTHDARRQREHGCDHDDGHRFASVHRRQPDLPGDLRWDVPRARLGPRTAQARRLVTSVATAYRH